MERVIVLGLSGCGHCESLSTSLKEENIPFKFIDADEDGKFADRMEDLLDTEEYPMVILEDLKDSVYLYRVNSIKESKVTSFKYGTKIGCISVDNMVAIVKKYVK